MSYPIDVPINSINILSFDVIIPLTCQLKAYLSSTYFLLRCHNPIDVPINNISVVNG